MPGKLRTDDGEVVFLKASEQGLLPGLQHNRAMHPRGGVIIAVRVSLGEGGLQARDPFILLLKVPAPSAGSAGVAPEDIENVFITHLHLDHVGWLMKDGQPFFPRATAYFGREDWAELVEDVPDDDPARVLMHQAESAGILRTYEPEDVEVLAGVTAIHVPGHTPGHVMIQLESKGEKIWFVGDLIEHPGQLIDAGIHFMTDVDRDLAASERARLFAQAKGEAIVIAAAHLDNPVFRRISAQNTRTDATLS